MRAYQLGHAINGFCPTDSISDNGLHVGIIENGEGFMAGLEIENPPIFTVEGDTGAEHFSAFVPTDENNIIRIRDRERLAIGRCVTSLRITVTQK